MCKAEICPRAPPGISTSTGECAGDAVVTRSGYDRQGYIDELAQGSDYELVNYKITDGEAKQDGGILVASFVLEADILVDGKPVTSQPSPSLVTFVRVDGQWKLASDAFFSK